VATVKHAAHGVSFDEPGKDSWRHLQAGSDTTMICLPDKIVVFKPVSGNYTLDEAVHLLGEDYDLILAEGFKQSDAPKIEVHRKDAGPPLKGIRKIMAVVTDEPLETRVRQFSPGDVNGLADFLEKGFIEPQLERISLYVNSNPIVLTAFPRQIISNTLLAMVSALRGVAQIKSLRIFLNRNPDNSRDPHCSPG
jgi:molybdopterin-guanine dinucleotide biosynthesis protein B